MPILNVDFKALEWRTIVELSGDSVAREEILAGLDFHSDNQKRFNLPSRLIAKVFLFRWIYLGSAYAYSKDPDFSPVGGEKFWQKIIDQFNDKYFGISSWHRNTVNTVLRHGKFVSPLTGRVYEYEKRKRRNGMEYNTSEVVNLPNQGLGADIVALVRAEYYNRYGNSGGLVLPILTVHDSLTFDCDYGRTKEEKPWFTAYQRCKEIVRELPYLWEQRYGQPLVVPHELEAEVGINYLTGHKLK